MVDPNGFLEEDDVEDQEMLGVGSETEVEPSLSKSILDFEPEAMEEDTGSQHSRGSQDQLSQASGSGSAPSFTASHALSQSRHLRAIGSDEHNQRGRIG